MVNTAMGKLSRSIVSHFLAKINEKQRLSVSNPAAYQCM
jgi:hypothetical protein